MSKKTPLSQGFIPALPLVSVTPLPATRTGGLTLVSL